MKEDCRVKMSLFDCVELGKTLFYFGLNFNGFVIPATENLKEFYEKWKDKSYIENPNQYTINIDGLNI